MNADKDYPTGAQPLGEEAGSPNQARVDGSVSEGLESSSGSQRPAGSGSPSSAQHEEGAPGSETDAHRLRQRHREGIFTEEDVRILEGELQEAFESGAPDVVWGTAQKQLRVIQQLGLELAQERFKANFGTSECESCDGLHAGPGVIETCFQLKRCYFGNRSQNMSNREASVVQKLLKTT